MINVEKLKEIGNEWESNDGSKHRIYFNNLPELLGIELEFNKYGDISNAEGISKSRARKIYPVLKEMKVWYDIDKKKFSFNYPSNEFEVASGLFKEIVSSIKDR